MLANRMDDEQTQKEIAEILMDLRTQFNIVDVIWPSISEDEEVEGDIKDNEGGAVDAGAEGEKGGLDGKEGDPDDIDRALF